LYRHTFVPLRVYCGGVLRPVDESTVTTCTSLAAPAAAVLVVGAGILISGPLDALRPVTVAAVDGSSRYLWDDAAAPVNGVTVGLAARAA